MKFKKWEPIKKAEDYIKNPSIYEEIKHYIIE